MKLAICKCGHSYLEHPNFGSHEPCSRGDCDCLDYVHGGYSLSGNSYTVTQSGGLVVDEFKGLADEITKPIIPLRPSSPLEVWEEMMRAVKGGAK